MGIRNSDLRKLKEGSSGIGGGVDLYESKTPLTFEFVGDNDTYTYEFPRLRFMRGRTKAARQAEKVLPSVLGLDFIMDNLNVTSSGRQFTMETRI
jgi:hypothetical protein